MRIVLTNISAGEGDALATKLVSEGLAACVNILAVRSVYRWQGEICNDPEQTLLIKVRADGVDALRSRIVELHPYDLPEIIALDVDTASSLPAYVDWVREQSSGAI